MKSLDEVGGRHPEFRDRQPDLPPLPPPEPDPRGPRRAESFTWVLWTFVGSGILVAAAYLLLFFWPKAPQDDFVTRLRAMVDQYRRDYGVLPRGDVADLRRALTGPGPDGKPYLAFPEAYHGDDGGLRLPDGRRLRYRCFDGVGYALDAEPAP